METSIVHWGYIGNSAFRQNLMLILWCGSREALSSRPRCLVEWCNAVHLPMHPEILGRLRQVAFMVPFLTGRCLSVNGLLASDAQGVPTVLS